MKNLIWQYEKLLFWLFVVVFYNESKALWNLIKFIFVNFWFPVRIRMYSPCTRLYSPCTCLNWCSARPLCCTEKVLQKHALPFVFEKWAPWSYFKSTHAPLSKACLQCKLHKKIGRFFLPILWYNRLTTILD